jgi:heterodisulfide reductase subunit C
MADETTPVASAPAPKPAAAPTKPAAQAKPKVEAPAYRPFPTIPALKPDAMVESNPYVAAAAHNEALGFPGTLVDGWEQKAVAKMGELLGKYRSLRVYMDACVHCGACTDKCHYFIGTGDPKNMPVARQDLMRSVYRRYYTLPGKLFPKLVGARDMTKDVLDDWFRYYNQCSECRRCSVFCPYGIDTAEVTMAAKEIMDSVGHGHKYVNEIMGKVHKIGNNLGLPGPALEEHAGRPGRGRPRRHRRGGQVSARHAGRRSTAGHPFGRLLRRAARGQPDRLRQGVPRRRHLLDVVLEGLRSRQFRHVHRQLRPDEEDRHARARSRAGTRRQAHRGRRMRPRLARRLRLLEHPDRHRCRRQRPLRRSSCRSSSTRTTSSPRTSAK